MIRKVGPHQFVGNDTFSSSFSFIHFKGNRLYQSVVIPTDNITYSKHF